MAAITRVYTIDRVARMLGIAEDLLAKLAATMEPEDGVLWVCDSTEHGGIAFTDFGIENARELLADPATLNICADSLGRHDQGV